MRLFAHARADDAHSHESAPRAGSLRPTCSGGKDAILSGPAAGVVGMAETGRAAGFSRLIGFDMGGTSTDVSHFAGEYERAFETEVAGVRSRRAADRSCTTTAHASASVRI